MPSFFLILHLTAFLSVFLLSCGLDFCHIEALLSCIFQHCLLLSYSITFYYLTALLSVALQQCFLLSCNIASCIFVHWFCNLTTVFFLSFGIAFVTLQCCIYIILNHFISYLAAFLSVTGLLHVIHQYFFIYFAVHITFYYLSALLSVVLQH